MNGVVVKVGSRALWEGKGGLATVDRCLGRLFFSDGKSTSDSARFGIVVGVLGANGATKGRGCQFNAFGDKLLTCGFFEFVSDQEECSQEGEDS